MRSHGLVYCAPRGLAILFIGFISMFALDVFNEQLSFWQTLQHLAIHLAPSFVMIAFLALAWRWECAGSAAFAACAVFFGVVRGPWWVKGVFVAPCLLTASLFLVNWVHRRSPAPR